MNNLKSAIKKAINESGTKWTAKKVWSINVSQTFLDEVTNRWTMNIELSVSKRKSKKKRPSPLDSDNKEGRKDE